MNLNNLRDMVNQAFESGVPGETIVCTECAYTEGPAELIDVEVHEGSYLNDPAPKMVARTPRSGMFVYLGSSGETEWGTGLLSEIPYKLNVVEIAEKS